ncbi:MAG: CoA transferase [Chloroflexota bacterium]|nr:CoA transferase [Chloroflexota bacterium]
MKPLDGIRVIDLSRLLPGPYCTMLLADLGAEVIKIETPGLGDYMRLIPPFIEDKATGESVGAAFLMVNRHKKSVALNFRNKRGKEILMRLVRDADVVLETFRPGAAEKWGIGYDALRAINPRLVYCSLSGYGQSGPYKDRAGHDLNYIALNGLLAANGAAGGPPIPPAVQIADLSGGMLATISILAALIGRGKTGAGQYLDVSLFDGALSWAGTMIGGAYAAGKKTERGKMQLNGGMACYNVYETRGGQHITIGAIEPHFWSAFCKAVGRDDLNARQQEFDAIPEVAAIFKTRTLDEWLALFKTLDACIEPVRDFSAVFSDPHIKHRGLIAEMDVPGIGVIPQIGSVFVFAQSAPTPPPRQGEHPREILERLESGDEEIGELEKAGVIKRGDRKTQG